MPLQQLKASERNKGPSSAAQAPILDPDTWIITSERVLRLEIPDVTILMGYANNIPALICVGYSENT